MAVIQKNNGAVAVLSSLVCKINAFGQTVQNNTIRCCTVRRTTKSRRRSAKNESTSKGTVVVTAET